MNIEALEIPTLADPRDVIRVRIINPDEWPAPPFNTELLVGVYRRTYFIFRAWSFWVRHDFYPARRVSSLLGAEAVQDTVDLLAAEYDMLRAGRSRALVYAS